MMQSLSDKLFMGSLILLMISIVVSGIGFQFVNWRTQVTDELDGETQESGSRKKAVMDRQDKKLGTCASFLLILDRDSRHSNIHWTFMV